MSTERSLARSCTARSICSRGDDQASVVVIGLHSALEPDSFARSF
jgi:hypothetical protein